MSSKVWLVVAVGLMHLSAAGALMPCLVLGTPLLSPDGKSIETQASLLPRVRAFLASENATLVRLDYVQVNIGAVGSSGALDVWSEPLNRFSWCGGAGCNTDSNEDQNSGLETQTKTWCVVVRYSAATCDPFVGNATNAANFVPIVFAPTAPIIGSGATGAPRSSMLSSALSLLCCFALLSSPRVHQLP